MSAYEILTRQKPFPGDSAGEILAAQMRAEGPVAPRELNPDIPPALEQVVLRCLERDPERRYPFSGVMLRDLQNTLYV